MKCLFLFDIDGTLTHPRKTILSDMLEFLWNIKNHRSDIVLGIVGGSDFVKAQEQLGDDILKLFTYVFSENGMTFYRDGSLVHERSLLSFVSQETLNEFINYSLAYMSILDLPVKTGTFIEYRKSMLNISPVGRNCSQTQRDDFEKYDNEHHIRQTMITTLQQRFPDFPMDYGIGGQISFDVYPKGLNKTYCLDYIPLQEFDEVHFFGDKVHPGGNDHEIFLDPRVIGHQVIHYHDTMDQCNTLLAMFNV